MSTTPKTYGFRWKFGQTALWFRDHWILAIITFLGATAVTVLPRVAVDEDGRLLSWALRTVTVLGTAAAGAVLFDRVADWHSKRLDQAAEEAERSAAQRSLTALLSLLGEIEDLAAESGVAREVRLTTLRSSIAVAAAEVPAAPGVRATYYPLTYDDDGYRQLRDPKSHGRVDQANTEFFERSRPDHPVWNVIASRDTDCTIYSAPDPSPAVDWKSRPYKTFISVPVSAAGVVFGMLSVNAPKAGDLTELDRLAVIAIARSMASALAMASGPKKLQGLRDQQNPASMASRSGEESEE